jgi:hypothetical protein
VELIRWFARRQRRAALERVSLGEWLILRPRTPGKATDLAVAERDAFRAELALMARGDAHPAAREIAGRLQQRVEARLQGRVS